MEDMERALDLPPEAFGKKKRPLTTMDDQESWHRRYPPGPGKPRIRIKDNDGWSRLVKSWKKQIDSKARKRRKKKA